jgi:hypothetical protein
MLSFPAAINVYLCTVPCDMRRSFDGLSMKAEHGELSASLRSRVSQETDSLILAFCRSVTIRSPLGVCGNRRRRRTVT